MASNDFSLSDLLPEVSETVRHPPNDHKLILSVSDNYGEKLAGPQSDLTLYVEKYTLETGFEAKNRDRSHPTKFQLFTNELVLKPSSGKSNSFTIQGADGGDVAEAKDEDKSNVQDGCPGGHIVLHMGNPPSADDKQLDNLWLDVSGGKGWTPTDILGKPNNVKGGDGGKGGTVNIWFGHPNSGLDPYAALSMLQDLQKRVQDSDETWPAKYVNEVSNFVLIYQRLQNQGKYRLQGEFTGKKLLSQSKENLEDAIENLLALLNKVPVGDRMSALFTSVEKEGKKWPDEFERDIQEFIDLSKEDSIKAKYKIPEKWTTVQAVTSLTQMEFGEQLYDMRMVATASETKRDLRQVLSQRARIRGGPYGGGSRGPGGKQGEDGSVTVSQIAEHAEDSQICFLHPEQCRMLLDKAKIEFYYGKDDNLIASANILQKLLDRLSFLAPTTDSDGNQSTTDFAASALAKAYREEAQRLFIPYDPSTKDTDEPIAIRQLRMIRDEAYMTLSHLFSGLNFDGHMPNEAPRGTFKFYDEHITKSLKYLDGTRKLYVEYVKAVDRLEAKKSALKSAVNVSLVGMTQNSALIDDAKSHISSSAYKIDLLTEPLKPAKKLLLEKIEGVKEKIKESFKVSAEDVIESLGTVLFTHGKSMVLMGALQTMKLGEEAATKIETDEGIKVKKSYLIKKIGRLTKGTVESLCEGYTALKDDSLKLTDPGAVKLLASKEEIMDVVQSISNTVGDGLEAKVRNAFDSYIGSVQKRNAEVARYNAGLGLLTKFLDQKKALQQSSKYLDVQERNMETYDPLVESVLRKFYIDALMDAQQWLSKAQRAYQFKALNQENVIGEALGQYHFGQLSPFQLQRVQQDLSSRYDKKKEANGRAPQHFHRKPFSLNSNWPSIQKSGMGARLYVDIPSTYQGFLRMTDVRLYKVRCFLEGAKTKSGKLRVSLTHTGNESIVDSSKKRHEFTHQPISVEFAYDLATLSFDEVDTSDGDIGAQTDGYALVGPFTQWKIDVPLETNDGLDLRGVKNAYLEFDGEFIPFTG
ncbi:hypothetical protein PT974_04736 [Cladobotryum mycophilum]|uniref:Serine protein kinase n=1 Tax=Cladobotryum mycophilum TaxID=491253 RepID=A0ABR0SQD6_9HYPO